VPARLTRGPVPGRRNSGTNSPDPRYRQALSATRRGAASVVFGTDTQRCSVPVSCGGESVRGPVRPV